MQFLIMFLDDFNEYIFRINLKINRFLLVVVRELKAEWRGIPKLWRLQVELVEEWEVLADDHPEVGIRLRRQRKPV